MDLIRSQWPAAIAAFFLWGGWALWVNHTAGTHTAIVSALTQGFGSAVFTLIMAGLVGIFSRWFRGFVSQCLIPPLLTVCCTTSTLVLAHHLAGTPNILYTIAAPTLVGALYCVYLSYGLARASALSQPPRS